jgi:hypothetical protein
LAKELEGKLLAMQGQNQELAQKLVKTETQMGQKVIGKHKGKI